MTYQYGDKVFVDEKGTDFLIGSPLGGLRVQLESDREGYIRADSVSISSWGSSSSFGRSVKWDVVKRGMELVQKRLNLGPFLNDSELIRVKLGLEPQEDVVPSDEIADLL